MWKAIFVTVLLSRGLHAVKVTRISSTVYYDGTPELMLPCEYVFHGFAKQPVIIRWQKGRETVLVRDSLGKIFPGPGFTNRCTFGHGCSLLLCQSTQRDSGNYTVKVIAPEDFVKSAIAQTTVIVTNSVTSKKTVPTTSKPFVNATQQHGCPTAADDPQNMNTMLAGCGFLAAVFFLVLFVVILSIWIPECGDEKDRRLPLPAKLISIFLLVSGEIVLITGMAVRNWSCMLVGIFCLFVTSFIPRISDILRRLYECLKKCHKAEREDSESAETCLSDTD